MAQLDASRQDTARPAAAAGGIRWSAAVWAGLISGLVFMMLEMIMVPVFLDGSPWGPPRMIAAIVLGEGVLPPPATFAAGIVAAAMVLHFALSVAYAIVVAFLVRRVGPAAAAAVGAGFGLVLYLVNFYGFTAVFPWFADARNWVSVFAHIVFGAVAGWLYVRLARGAPARVGAGGDPERYGAV